VPWPRWHTLSSKAEIRDQLDPISLYRTPCALVLRPDQPWRVDALYNEGDLCKDRETEKRRRGIRHLEKVAFVVIVVVLWGRKPRVCVC
jgi:hypothetical protein